MRATTNAAPARLRSIGDVIAELRAEFPDLTPSKLRFLESEGLVTPARLPNGYRKYTDAHIRRLRVVLTLQRDQYLPLRVIMEKLALYDAGHDVLREAAPQSVDVRDERPAQAEPVPESQRPLRQRIGDLAASTFGPTEETQTLGREELLAQSGLTRADLAEIEESRLISAMPSGRYDQDALIVATVVARLAERGVQVRHIRPTRHTVDREIGNIETLLAAQRKRRLSGDSQDQQSLAESQREIAGGFLALHAALLRIALRSSL